MPILIMPLATGCHVETTPLRMLPFLMPCIHRFIRRRIHQHRASKGFPLGPALSHPHDAVLNSGLYQYVVSTHSLRHSVGPVTAVANGKLGNAENWRTGLKVVYEISSRGNNEAPAFEFHSRHTEIRTLNPPCPRKATVPVVMT